MMHPLKKEKICMLNTAKVVMEQKGLETEQKLKIDISCGDFSSAETAKATGWRIVLKPEGRKPMPSFKEKLSDKWALEYY